MNQHATAFVGTEILARGPLAEVALAIKAAEARGDRPLAFSDETGRVIDLDLRGSDAEIVARLAAPDQAAPAPRGRGRPKLGVIAREVTLLPRHWEWLNAQPGGASQALRRLVEEARKKADPRQARDRAYRFLSAMAGDLPGFEDAARALFAGDVEGFRERMSGWPKDVAAYAEELARAKDPSPPL